MLDRMPGQVDDSGSAYHQPIPSFDADLVSVGRGTPGGELLRRYWHPIALSAQVKDLPVPVRVLGEDLILFRTPRGRPGLVYPRCVHRGTTLLYGKVEEHGIRCCYHGWLFDPQGRCLDQPCEPDGGRKRGHYRQPWYPVEERYGLVFAYLGPLDRLPLLPHYDVLEELEHDERLVATAEALGQPDVMPCNWFQFYENTVDPYHVFILHSTFSSSQFNDIMTIRPEIWWEHTEHGVVAFQVRTLGDGSVLRRMVEVLLPTVRVVPIPTTLPYGRTNSVSWTLPLDDTHTAVLRLYKLRADEPPPVLNHARLYDGKTWFELDAEGHQRWPGDWEAQVGQGEITLHSEEHLVSSDRGVSMLRRLYREAIKTVRDGGDPLGVRRTGNPLVTLRAGNFLIPAGTPAPA
jgi:phenylpropionate dioxygenase-like ring-hydroxylating dioxygenase large terminal subunit